MTRPPAAPYLLVAILLLAGCSSGADHARRSPTASASSGTAVDCAQVPTPLLRSVQAYVDSYAPALTPTKKKNHKPAPSSSAAPGSVDLKAALQRAQSDLKKGQCSTKRFSTQFTRGLDRVRARGPLAEAILLRLTASLTGTLGSSPQQVRIGPKDDLPETLAKLASGSTVRLKKGAYRLARPLVILAGVTVRGVGAKRTTITSPAAGSALLLLTDEVVELQRLSLRHVGKAPASVVVTSPGAALGLTDVTVSGGTGASAVSSAGSGVSMSSGRAVGQQTRTTLEITGGAFTDNAAAGLLLSGDHRASIRHARFASNGQCGVCFGGSSSGAVRDSTFTDNSVGVAVFGKARPIVQGDRFHGGQVGVQVADHGAPAVLKAEVEGATRAAMIFTGSSRGRVDDSTCTAVPYGIVVGKQALPYLGKNDCQVSGSG